MRSTCLGMMAGNLVYGPTPSYPVAAAAARVEGEVKIQATIDRDGTVNAARVVSGPPLLRDAALDAVQHWRYKPYMAAGKPAPTGTMAVVDFELQ
ncbi:energy transducer TonB [Terriglobus sp.]|uniref:energy transducer TonB n=1 Tax=Terriglobus sp. TaxID=1889013 RepID=UPI003B00BE2A